MSDWADEARARLGAASCGPWLVDAVPDQDGDVRPVVFMADGAEIADVYAGDRAAEDAALIAHARTDLPRALDCIEAADRLIAADREVIQVMDRLQALDARKHTIAEGEAAYEAYNAAVNERNAAGAAYMEKRR